jgi:hypothetical protein
MAGRREEGLVIVERDEIQDDLRDPGMGRAQERLGTAGAFLEVKPDDRRLQPAAGRLDYLGSRGRRETDRGRRHRAHLDEVTPRDGMGIERRGSTGHDDSF